MSHAFPRLVFLSCVVTTALCIPSSVASAQSIREVAVVRALDAAPGDMLGERVALSANGDTLAASATGRSLDGLDAAGAVYVFARRGNVYRQQAVLVSPSPAQAAQFGLGLALSSDGNTLATMNGLHDPRVHVFRRSGGQWTFELDLVREVRSFGMSRDGTCIAAALTRGVVQVFRRTAEGWTEDSVLPHVDARAITIENDCASMALSVVSGVIVYDRTPSGWTVAPQGILRPGSPLPPDPLAPGVSFVRGGNTIVLVSPRSPCGGADPQGGSYTLYERTDARGWSLTRNIELGEATCPSMLAMTSDGARMVAGHGWAQLGTTPNPAGALHVRADVDALRLEPYASVRGQRHPSRLGDGVAMTADGATVAAGAPNEGPRGGRGLDGGGPGAVHIYRVR